MEEISINYPDWRKKSQKEALRADPNGKEKGKVPKFN
jgi:hypothetical protein